MAENGGTWHQGNWKGRGSSNYRISRDAIEMMNEAVIGNTNRVVGEDDTLHIMGDVTFTHDYERMRYFRQRINCKHVHLVWGNHDDRDKLRDLFEEVSDLSTIVVKGQKIILCHYALAVWDQSHRGSICLYGHSHGGAEKWLDKIMPGRRSLDVGIDNALKILGECRPFSFEEIMNYMKNRPGHRVGEIDIDPNTPREEDLRS